MNHLDGARPDSMPSTEWQFTQDYSICLGTTCCETFTPAVEQLLINKRSNFQPHGSTGCGSFLALKAQRPGCVDV